MKILITGVSGGIGGYLLSRLKDSDFLVFGTYNLREPKIESTHNLSKVDISDQTQVKNWIDESVTSFDEIVLINCVGINYDCFAHKAEVERWRHVIDVNLVGTFRVINAVLHLMREKGFGRVINISSVVAQKGVPGTSAYAASKAALWGMTKCLAVENASKGITINNLNLGYFDIGMTTRIQDKILDDVISGIPSGKLGEPDNIYDAVMFLINSDYTNGASFDINGGLV